MDQSLVLFEEGFFERIWGGTRLRESLGLGAPPDRPIGEAWLVSDHPSHESRILNGPWRGLTLHQLLERHPDYLLGTLARPTVHGRFPLLLKVLDAADVLSVQVHPDDEMARELGEPDVGKTEMWHVLDSQSGSELICGLDPALDRAGFLAAAADGSIEAYMRHFPAPPGTTTFVAAGTVHAIGAGILLAEIQQNSDLTYRIHDWNRVDFQGRARELHLDKAAMVTAFGSAHGGPAAPLSHGAAPAQVTVLGACRYFASELLHLQGTFSRTTNGTSFHIVMPRDGAATLQAGGETHVLQRCQAALIPAGVGVYKLTGAGFVLDYYVPDLREDIIAPLRRAGHADRTIAALGGSPECSDLAAVVCG